MQRGKVISLYHGLLKSNMISPDTEQLTVNANKSKQHSTHLLQLLDSCKLNFWEKKTHRTKQKDKEYLWRH